MTVQDWNISGPISFAYTVAEVAQIARAAQAFQAALAEVGGSRAVHLVSLSNINVLDGAAKVTWPQPGDAVIQLAPCEVCGFKDWPEGGMRAARSIHVRGHQLAGVPGSGRTVEATKTDGTSALT